jgi:hypothetical protein
MLAKVRYFTSVLSTSVLLRDSKGGAIYGIKSTAQKALWSEIRRLLNDLIQNPGTLDAKTDLIFNMVDHNKS